MNLAAVLERSWQKHKESVYEIRRELHQYPEGAFKEENTSKTIIKWLEIAGVTNIKRIAKTGVMGVLQGGGPGKVLAIRAEMDALNLQEKTSLPYSSRKPGWMHACGHDAHMAMAIGAALVLGEMKDKWKGQVKFIFQPAEEEGGGAKRMIEEGVLDDPAVDAIIALHLWPDLPEGTIGLRDGICMASNDKFSLCIRGRATHAASPHKGIDSILLGATTVIGIQQLVSREINPLDSVVISIGVFKAGSSYNIIPGETILEGTVRTLDPSVQDKIESRLKEFIMDLAHTFGGQAEFTYTRQYPMTINNPNFNRVVAKAASKIWGRECVIWLDKPTMAAEDFSFFLERVPGALVFLGCANTDGKPTYPLHHECFQFNEEILGYGTMLLVQTVMQFN